MAYGEADYIIIGGGLTGCALASRLHQGDPSLDILVLEPGIDASDNPKTRNLEGAFALAGSDLDYNYKSTPQPNTCLRPYCGEGTRWRECFGLRRLGTRRHPRLRSVGDDRERRALELQRISTILEKVGKAFQRR